jgi:DNA-binding transcriptional MerR regulator
MPSGVLIQYDRCRLELYLPVYFDEMPLDKVRKVMKLLDQRPYQNDAAHETLDAFFPEWERELKDRLERAKADLSTAKLDAEEKRRTRAAFGSTLDERIAEAKQKLKLATRRKKSNPNAYERCKQNYEYACAPKTDHEKAVKAVKTLESTVKTATAAVERGGKIITLYKAIRQSKN